MLPEEEHGCEKQKITLNVYNMNAESYTDILENISKR
jgi:hypothetical protein